MLIVFEVLAVASISAGGLLAGFTARKPTRLKSWTSAYLVLVAGLLQLGIVSCLQNIKYNHSSTLVVALVVYNLGNLAVIWGRAVKDRSRYSLTFVSLGCLLLGLSVALIAWTIRLIDMSGAFFWLTLLLITVIISMVVGLIMSIRSSKSTSDK